MADTLQLSVVSQASGSEWDASMAIYRAAFPEWEREPESVMAERINSGSYLLISGLINNKVVGFYILELCPSLAYVMFNYLVVDESLRGRGIGTHLCRDAMQRFNALSGYSWFFIEAEERLAIFYGRLGFWKLRVEYLVPRYDGEGSMPMHLMVLPCGKVPDVIMKNELAEIIRRIFINGYLLSEDDSRIATQLAYVEEQTDLIRWPQQEKE